MCGSRNPPECGGGCAGVVLSFEANLIDSLRKRKVRTENEHRDCWCGTHAEKNLHQRLHEFHAQQQSHLEYFKVGNCRNKLFGVD
jgi:hypothetical protein